MLDSSLSQLEALVSELVQRNQVLHSANAQLSAELVKVKDDNDTLQLNLLEQEEQHGHAAARIQALVERASAASHAGAVNQ